MNPASPRLAMAVALALLAPLVMVAAPATDAASTHVAGKTVIKSKAQIDAVVEATETEPIRISPKAWADLTVLEAVAHGSRVKKGDLLIKLDVDKLRDQIEDLESDRPLSSLTLELAQHELENLRQTTPHKLEAARRSFRIAEEDYTHFESIGRPQREKNSKFTLKSAEQRLENASEELKQLEKMYKADDLTEETEEIVLKRQKFAVEAAQLGLQNSRENTERDLKVFVPREDESLKNAKRDQEIATALAEQTLPKTLSKKQLDLEKLKRDHRKSEKRLTDLRYDLDLLTPRAPVDGLIYYGACENGRWTTGPVVQKKLVPGGKLMPNEILMTIVNPDKLRLRAIIPEGELGTYKAGMKGEAAPLSSTDRKLPVKLDDVAIVPLPGGGFDATLSLTKDKNLRLLPGMNCKVTFTNIEKNVSIAVPKKALFTDNATKVIYVQKADGSNEKRTVKTGDSDDEMTEITEGLNAGEKVLLKKPEQG